MAHLKAPIVLLSLVIASGLALAGDPYTATVAAVHDGDTVTVVRSTGEPVKIRLNGIDAPELKQPGGTHSRDVLSTQILGKSATIYPVKIDIYRRTVAKIVVDGRDVCLSQILSGNAWYFFRYRYNVARADRPLYAAAEATARAAQTGLWSNDKPEQPWTFRKRKAQ